jgi:NADH-quinone oxidoreductase subunit E
MQTTENQDIRFSVEQLARVQEIIKRYPEGKQKSALLPLLHMVQETWGWVSTPAMDYVASLLNIKPIEVYEVATFYSMYHVEPVGKFVFEVCRTSPCCLRGAENIVSYLENKLNIKEGETTPDGMFTIKTVECLAACGMAPMMQVGYNFYEHLTEEKVDNIIEQFRNSGDAKPHYDGSVH